MSKSNIRKYRWRQRTESDSFCKWMLFPWMYLVWRLNSSSFIAIIDSDYVSEGSPWREDEYGRLLRIVYCQIVGGGGSESDRCFLFLPFLPFLSSDQALVDSSDQNSFISVHHSLSIIFLRLFIRRWIWVSHFSGFCWEKPSWFWHWCNVSFKLWRTTSENTEFTCLTHSFIIIDRWGTNRLTNN